MWSALYESSSHGTITRFCMLDIIGQLLCISNVACPIFSRVPTLSIRPSVVWLVSFYHFTFLKLFYCLTSVLQPKCSNMAPAHPHATGVTMYPALLAKPALTYPFDILHYQLHVDANEFKLSSFPTGCDALQLCSKYSDF